MKKILYTIYSYNLLLIITLFLIYRFFLLETKQGDGWFNDVMNIIALVLNLAATFFFPILAILTSLTIFLNLNSTVRNNRLLSLITFCGLPFIGFVYMMVDTIQFFILNYKSPIQPLAIIVTIYLFATIIEFVIFRKMIKRVSQKPQE